MTSDQPAPGQRRRIREPGRDPASVPVSNASPVNVPNALTLLRILMLPFFAYYLLADSGDSEAYRTAAAAIFVVASITDFLDGYIARRQGIVTTFGKVADPIADKALTGTALIGLALLGELPWWVPGIILTREVLVTVLRFWVIQHGVISAGRGGKLKTVSQMVAITLFLLPGVPDTVRWWAMGIAIALTILTGLDYVRKALAVRAMGELRIAAGVPRPPDA
jgi:CDP-diacylglycerol--glycerol-3-phosphate 3-phosphatidyltransferase